MVDCVCVELRVEENRHDIEFMQRDVLGTDGEIHRSVLRGNSEKLSISGRSPGGMWIVREIGRQAGRGHLRKAFCPLSITI